MRRRLLFLCALGLFGCGAPNKSATCPVGAEGCACTSGGACDPGLSCLSRLCVDPRATGAETSSPEETAGGSGRGGGPGGSSTTEGGGPGDASTGDPAQTDDRETSTAGSATESATGQATGGTGDTGPGDATCDDGRVFDPVSVECNDCVACGDAEMRCATQRAKCEPGSACADFAACLEACANDPSVVDLEACTGVGCADMTPGSCSMQYLGGDGCAALQALQRCRICETCPNNCRWDWCTNSP